MASLTQAQALEGAPLDGLYDAIADGLRPPGLKQKQDTLEARKQERKAQLVAPLPSPVRLHSGLSEFYHKKVEELAQTLADPDLQRDFSSICD